MRLDEIGENYENLKTQVISYSFKKAEQSRAGQADTAGPLDVHNVSDSEKDDEDWENVAWMEIRRSMRCWNCGLMGHIGRDCRGKGEGKGKGYDGRKR